MNNPNIKLVSDDVGETGGLTIEPANEVHPATLVIEDLKVHSDKVVTARSNEQDLLNTDIADLDAFDREYETKRDLMVKNIGHRKARIDAYSATFEQITNSAIALERISNIPEGDTERTAGRKVRKPRRKTASVSK